MRGVTADIVIMEEASFISKSLFFEVIVPLMGVRGTVVLAISTPDAKDDNYYSFLMDIKFPVTNKPLFKTIRIGLACDVCVAADKGASCTHKADVVPHWKSTKRQEKMRMIMAADENLFLRENLGMIASGTQYMFSTRAIARFRDATLTHWTRPPHVVFTAIDPSGGGTHSDYAIASVHVEDGHHGIIGLDHSASGFVEDINLMVVNHIRGIRRLPGFGAVVVVVIIESNMSWLEADRLARLCAQPALQPVIIESKDTSGAGRPGVITDENNKAGYVSVLRDLMERGSITYAPQLTGGSVAASRLQLEEQMRNFKRAIKAPNDPEHAKYKVTYTGKGYARKDDLIMALMMVCYWSACTMGDESFIRQCEENAWRVG